MTEKKQIAPQSGPQEEFLSCPADICIYGGAAGSGKLLPIDTPLPSPCGWILMGDISEGDQLFDENGDICTVLKAYDIEGKPELYRFTFDDGSIMDSCVDHLWNTLTASDLAALTRRTPEYRARRREKRPSRVSGNKSGAFVKAITERNGKEIYKNPKPVPTGSVKTTREIVTTLKNGRRANHAIVVADALELPEVNLIIDPYLFGLWLGDGTGVTGAITTSDIELTTEWTKVKSTKYTYRVHGLTTKLKKIGVLGNKHIPIEYLRASKDQRLELLKGLMDSDGTVSKESGSVSFANTNEKLIDGFIELCCSLGFKPGKKIENRSKLNGIDCGPVWDIKFTPSEYVFKLDRKKKYQKLSTRRTTKFRYIVKADPIESRPGRCIRVDSKSRLYLAGKRMIPTHNTFAELLEPLHYITSVPGFNAICFRRTTPMIRSGGGLWDESLKLYSGRAEPKETTLEWLFPCKGAQTPNRLKFAHLEYEKNALDYQGAQLCLIQFDELTHFTEYQFWYLLSRNRSVCGVQPYVRATCNPDPDSWLIVGPDGWGSGPLGWWIDRKTGYPIKERSGVIRHFIRENNQLIWSDYPDELTDEHPDLTPKSFTFIAATLEDNPILMNADPAYRANLLALPEVEKERLLYGNWKIRPAGGNVFKREWFRQLVPENILQQSQWQFKIGSWDTAYEIDDPDIPKKKKDAGPDYSVYTLWGINQQGYFLLDRYKEKLEFSDLVSATLRLYYRDRPNALLIEKKASGISLIQTLKAGKHLIPWVAIPRDKTTGSKLDRAYQTVPFFKNGFVHFPSTAFWLHDYIEEMVSFPDAAHDDSVDSTSQAIIWYSQGGFSGGGKRAVQVIEDDYYI